MRKILAKTAELKNRLTPDEFNLVQDLLSEQDAEWQKKLRNIPLLMPILGAFGLVATFYGFEKIIDRTFLANEPELLLALGLGILLVTGMFYQKL